MVRLGAGRRWLGGSSRFLLVLLSLASPLPSTGSAAEVKIQVQPLVSEQQLVLTAATLGILVNLNDPNSIELGQRYAEIRGIPSENIIGERDEHPTFPFAIAAARTAPSPIGAERDGRRSR